MKNKLNQVRMDYLYRNEWKTKDMTMDELWQQVKEGKYLRLVKGVRGEEAVATRAGLGVKEVAASDLPKIWPAWETEGAYSGRVLLSLRIADDGQLFRWLRQRVSEMPQTEWLMTGSSGTSLKVVMRYSLPDGTLPTEEQARKLFQQYAFRRACDFMQAATGVKAEDDEHYGTGWFRISADPDAYWNAEPAVIPMSQPLKPLTEHSAPITQPTKGPELSHEVLPGYSRLEMDLTKFSMICRNLSFQEKKEPQQYLLQLACECRKAGIDQEVAAKSVLVMEPFRGKETLVNTTFDNAYNNHLLGSNNPIEPALMNQQLMKAFLKKCYHFRRNTVTGDIEYQEKGRYLLAWRPLTTEVRNDINNAAIDRGIKVWPKDMDRLLGSGEVADYDPVDEWLSALPRWDGRDRLGEMAARVPTETPSWEDDFKVWMRSMVNQWMGRSQMYGAQMVLMLLGGQGTRKSTFMRMLLPPQLSPYYIDRIDFANKNEALRALGRFLLINMDEYDQITKSQTAYLKHLIQRTDVMQRKMYETTYQQQQRYAAFCATTNSLQPLKDESGSRRYLVVEVTGVIDTDVSDHRKIDYEQLYAQVVEEITNGEDYYFDGERERRITERNRDYYDVPTVVQLFDDMFRKPQPGDEVLKLSPTEILEMIRQQKKVSVGSHTNSILLGNYLKSNAFRRGSGRERRKYEVALKPA